MTLHLEIVTQEELVFEDETVDMVIVPAAEGIMGVLPHHAPVLTTLGFGELVVRKGNAEERFAIYGGVVDIRPDKVIVLADTAESSYAVDSEKAEEARERARKTLEEGVAPGDNREAELSLRRANLAIKVSQKVRRSGPMLRILDEDAEA